jgi:ArsR family metal-binding transcriptional regulator
VNPLILVILAIYTIGIIYGIHRYEDKIKDLNSQIETHIVSYYNSVDIIQTLDKDNETLKAQIEQIKVINTELKAGLHTGYPASHI